MPIRITALLRKREGVTHAEFSKHWGGHHAEIFTALDAVKKNLVRYNQFHVLPEPSETLKGLGIPLAPYDGAAEFWVDKVEDILALFGDAEYQATAIPDEGNFLDRTSVQLLVGEDQTKYQK